MLKLTQKFIVPTFTLAFILFASSSAAYAIDNGSITWINNPIDPYCSGADNVVLYSHPALHRCGLHTKGKIIDYQTSYTFNHLDTNCNYYFTQYVTFTPVQVRLYDMKASQATVTVSETNNKCKINVSYTP